MPHDIPFEDEGVFRTDEQAGTSSDQFKRTEKQFDPNHPPVQVSEDPNPDLVDPKVMWHQKDDVRTSEQDEPQKELHKEYPQDV